MGGDHILNFTKFETFQKRLADKHGALRDKAIGEINQLIHKADALPIILPVALFSDVPAVRGDLINMLRQSGWVVRGPSLKPLGETDPDSRGEKVIELHAPDNQSDWRTAK